MGHGIDEPSWVARFAAAMCAEQSAVDHALASQVARIVHPTLGNLLPEDAVTTYLAVAQTRYNSAGDVALQALSRIRDSR